MLLQVIHMMFQLKLKMILQQARIMKVSNNLILLRETQGAIPLVQAQVLKAQQRTVKVRSAMQGR